MPNEVTDPRDAIVRAFAAALRAADPMWAVRDQLTPGPDNAVEIAEMPIPAETPIEAVAIGKAAPRMMLGVVDALGDRLGRGYVLTKDGHTSDGLPDSVVQAFAAHPILDERSLSATADLIDWIEASPREGVMLCLISGGASALLELPVQGVSLQDFQGVTRMLLNAGADIYQLNAVRSQISQVKGGRLRGRIPSATVINLIVSDVLGNDISVIASGPTVRPVSTSLDALAVIESLGVARHLPSAVRDVLHDSCREQWQESEHDQTVIIADNELAISAAETSLRASGFKVERCPVPGTGEASERAREWTGWLKCLPGEVTAAIGGGEYTVEVRGTGVGGRNTEFALVAAIELDRLAMTDWTVASLATDGDDAMTAVAGGIVDGSSARLMAGEGISPLAALANNDSMAALEAIGAGHGTGPTGTNVNDLYFAVRS